jgi:hypothetical protein
MALSLGKKITAAKYIVNNISTDTLLAGSEKMLNYTGYLGLTGSLRFWLGIVEVIFAIGYGYMQNEKGKKIALKYVKHGGYNMTRGVIESMPLISFTMPAIRLLLIAYDALGIRMKYCEDEHTKFLELHTYVIRFFKNR